MKNKLRDSGILKIVKEKMKELKPQLTDGQKGEILNLIKNIMSGESFTLKGFSRVNQQLLESLYTLAYQMYNNEQYDTSGSIFSLLHTLDPNDTRFTMGMGASRQMEKDYANAIIAYIACNRQDLSNPIPALHLYKCYQETNDIDGAFFALCEAVTRIQRNHLYAPLLNKTMMLLEGLREQVEADVTIIKEKSKTEVDQGQSDTTQPLLDSVENDTLGKKTKNSVTY